MSGYDEEFWGEALWADELEPGFDHAIGEKGGECWDSCECYDEYHEGLELE